MKTQAEIDKNRKVNSWLVWMCILGMIIGGWIYDAHKEPAIEPTQNTEQIKKLEQIIEKQQEIISNAVNVVNGVEATNYAIKRNLVRFGELGEILVSGTTNLIAKSTANAIGTYPEPKETTNFVHVVNELKKMDNRITFWVGENFTNWTNIKLMLGENKESIDSLRSHTLNVRNSNVQSVQNVPNAKVFGIEDMELAERVGYDLEGTIRKQIETAIRIEMEGNAGVGRDELRIRLQRQCDEIIERSFQGFKVYQPTKR